MWNQYIKNPMPIEQVFWSKVNKNGPIIRPELGPCWIWIAGENGSGYGQFFNTKDRQITSHTYSWKLHNGPIPTGMEVCHRCDVKLCVRPNHLFLGTQADNMHDRDNKGRHSKYTGWFDGINGPNHKLTEQQVREIRHSTFTTRKLAKLFNISKSQAHTIKSGKCWKHIV
jgi:hypothetical protein